MRKMFALVVSGILLISTVVFAEENTAKATKDDKLIVTDEVQSDGDGVKKVLDQILNSQGLQFTLGGVRPMESTSGVYPTIGDDVILLTPNQNKK